MLEVNTDLVSGNFENDGVLQPSMEFWRALEIECLENKIGVELGDNGWQKRAFKNGKIVSLWSSYIKSLLWQVGFEQKKGEKWNKKCKAVLSQLFWMR